MKQCSGCKWNYPEGLLALFATSWGNQQEVCGICALTFENQIHGTRKQKLYGTKAEQLRQDAKAWRKVHPDCAPSNEVKR